MTQAPGAYHLGWAPTLHPHARLSGNKLRGTNALAYFAAASVTKKKCFTTLTQDERLLDSTASAVGVN